MIVTQSPRTALFFGSQQSCKGKAAPDRAILIDGLIISFSPAGTKFRATPTAKVGNRQQAPPF
jgi:hypothetical protein